MNRPTDHFDEREWRLQERALREERLASADSGDAEVEAYRRVVRALREPLPEALPAGFAAGVAKRVATRQAQAQGGFERALLQGLSAAFAASALYVAAGHGGEWLRASLQLLPAASAAEFRNWGLVLGACVALTWALGRLRDHGGHASG